MATSPDALVYATLEDPVVEPGETVSFSGSAPVQLTGSPAVIPDDASAQVDWQFAEPRDMDDC